MSNDIVMAQHAKVFGWDERDYSPKPAQPVYDRDDIVGFIYKVNDSTLDIITFEQMEFDLQTHRKLVVVKSYLDEEEISQAMTEALQENMEMAEFWDLVLRNL